MKSAHGRMQRTNCLSHTQNTGSNSSRIQFSCKAVGALRAALAASRGGLQCPGPSAGPQPAPGRAFACTTPCFAVPRGTAATAPAQGHRVHTKPLIGDASFGRYTISFFLKQMEVVQKSFVNTSHISVVLQSTRWSPSLLGGKGRQNVFHTLVLLAA